MVDMKLVYIKSLKLIKEKNVKTEAEYKKLMCSNLILSLETLKYMSQMKFQDIVKMIEEVEEEVE